MTPPTESVCVSSLPGAAGYEEHKKAASQEDKQYMLEIDVRETDFDIQMSETQSTHEVVSSRYPWYDIWSNKGRKRERGRVAMLIRERGLLIPPMLSQVTKNRKMAESICI